MVGVGGSGGGVQGVGGVWVGVVVCVCVCGGVWDYGNWRTEPVGPLNCPRQWGWAGQMCGGDHERLQRCNVIKRVVCRRHGSSVNG